MHVRKEHAGSSSLGYTWDEDGAVVEVDDEHVPALLAIRDGGFTVVPAPADPAGGDDTDPAAQTAPEGQQDGDGQGDASDGAGSSPEGASADGDAGSDVNSAGGDDPTVTETPADPSANGRRGRGRAKQE